MRRRTGTIGESQKSLLQLEREYRHQPQELRLKALRLLKEHPEWSLQQVADLLGRSLRTVQRWWKTYQQEGIEGLLEFSKGGGKRPVRLREEGLRELEHYNRMALLISRRFSASCRSASESATATPGFGTWYGSSSRPICRRQYVRPCGSIGSDRRWWSR